jgi:predicted nucleic acid-binding protein
VGLVLDTSIIVDAQRGKFDLDLTLTNFAHTDIFISSTTVSELFFDYELAKTHADICAKLSKEGNLIGPNDLIIAASCIHYQHSLLTFNIKEFSRVPNLLLESIN